MNQNVIFDKFEPPTNCEICPRLSQFRLENRQQEPTWHNQPVAPFYPTDNAANTQLLIIGLAPGLRGANRTGRPFTADYAGDLLYSTLKLYGLAKGEYEAKVNDSLELIKTAIVNSVRCVPPLNKPLGAEINNCRQFFAPIIFALPKLKAILTLGSIAHNSTLRALGLKTSLYPFGHNRKYQIKTKKSLYLFSSYHCSRYNTNTGRLTEEMFHRLFENIKQTVELS
ncbi:uracil-DNA glycosylase [Bartonella sp. TP]|uniref:uracil-DNA glycosylase n=1 Tax=Bartonella sp. TP TaxID=3057550 RepID=UPI0025B18BD8|nr:uracil-DNA glycosylase [Bartonella sp. TP]MDN5249282.1 uracil-DNA glycosylase [Alphaproteobacteria bacterium]WJW80148.1 uracil-DNA glycosylase [Bartonella sp. TP]